MVKSVVAIDGPRVRFAACASSKILLFRVIIFYLMLGFNIPKSIFHLDAIRNASRSPVIGMSIVISKSIMYI